jgi:hypothetical protein
MIYKPDPKYLRERSKELINARNWGIGLITSLLGVGLFISEIERIRSLKPDVINYLYLALFAITGLLIFLWIWATQKELDMFFEWLDPDHYDPPSTIKETLLILIFAFLLISLLFAARNPLWFSAVFSVYSIIGIPTEKYLTSEIKLAIDKSKSRATNDLSDDNLKKKAEIYLQALEVLNGYFILRPMKLRSLLVAAFSIVGLSLGIMWEVYDSRLAGIFCYMSFILNISISEAVIAYWRIVRDSSIRPITAELRELSRS